MEYLKNYFVDTRELENMKKKLHIMCTTEALPNYSVYIN